MYNNQIEEIFVIYIYNFLCIINLNISTIQVLHQDIFSRGVVPGKYIFYIGDKLPYSILKNL